MSRPSVGSLSLTNQDLAPPRSLSEISGTVPFKSQINESYTWHKVSDLLTAVKPRLVLKHKGMASILI